MNHATDKEAQSNALAQPGVNTPERNLPKGLFKMVNPVMKAVLRSPLHGRVSGSLMLLSFKGRKTGKVYSTPVGYHEVGGDLLVFTHSPWWRNLQGGAPVKLVIQKKALRGYAEAVEDEEEVFLSAQHLLSKIGIQNARRLGIFLNKGHEPSEEELRAATKGTIMLRIKVTGSASVT